MAGMSTRSLRALPDIDGSATMHAAAAQDARIPHEATWHLLLWITVGANRLKDLANAPETAGLADVAGSRMTVLSETEDLVRVGVLLSSLRAVAETRHGLQRFLIGRGSEDAAQRAERRSSRL